MSSGGEIACNCAPDANNHALALAYDGLDRLGTTTYPNASTEVLTYDADGNVKTRQTRAGQIITFAYDRLNRLSSKTPPSPAAAVSYQYDRAGRVTGVSDSSASITPPAGGTVAAITYSYDGVNRLTATSFSPVQAQAPPGASSASFAFAYNASNQRIGQTATDNGFWAYPAATPSTVSYTANNLNQYTAVGAVTPSYDGNGNLTYDGNFTYCYDAENRLVAAINGGTCASPTATVATYSYDAQGQRKSKTVSGTTTITVTDPFNRALLDYDGSSGAILRWYAFGLGSNDVLNQTNVALGTRTTFIPDIQGSIVATLDSTTGTVTKTGYLPYGASPGSPVTFGYTAQRIDPETNGLYYYRARHYSPLLGRFMQPDPIGTRGGINLYAYTNNDPVNRTDPTGLSPFVYGTSPVLGVNASGALDANGFGPAPPSLLQSIHEVINPFTVFGSSSSPLGLAPGGGLGWLAGVLPVAAPAGAVAAESSFSTVARVAELQSAIPLAQQGRITMGVGLAEDVNGVRQVLIGTSEPMGYLRPGVTLNPGETLAPGLGHAEEDIVNYAQKNGLNLLEVGATRPICPSCASLISGAGATPVTPLKVP